MSEWFTAEDIAQLRGTTVGYVRNLANAHKWRRTRTRPVRYNIRDVLESLKPAKD